MGEEVGTYMDRIVASIETAYGPMWNINKRPESAAEDSLPWQVQIGVSRQMFEPDGALGLNLKLECAATVRYVSKADTHASAFQAIDIANSLAAWLANTVDEVSGVLPHSIEVAPEPVMVRVSGQDTNTGRYIAHVFWTVDFDRIDPDIDIEGYTTRHPARKSVVDSYYWEIELMDGTKRVVMTGVDEPPPHPEGAEPPAGYVRRIFMADPDNIPATTDTEAYYPVRLEEG